MDGDKKVEVLQMASDAAEQWRMVLEAAEDTQRCCKMSIIFYIKAGAGLVRVRTIPSFHQLFSPLRQLTAVSDLMHMCQTRRVQAEHHLSGLKNQASGLPRLFPWPGLGERRQALEQAQSLLEKTAAMAPVLSDVRQRVKYLTQV